MAPTLLSATSFYEPMQGGAIRRHGIVDVTEDRKLEGRFDQMSIAENL